MTTRSQRFCTAAAALSVVYVFAVALFGPSARAADDKPTAAASSAPAEFFNGKDLSNWDGRADVFRVENGEIVGETKTGLKNNEFLKNRMTVKDFRLVLKVKLVPDKENSGIQFRSQPLPKGPEMKGYQADMGKGWWGTLYHESGRGKLWTKQPPAGTVKLEDWNTYEIVAVGHRVLTAINGVPCVDLDDPQGELEGLIALQVHSGGPTEVRFKDFELETDVKVTELKTVRRESTKSQERNPK